MSITNMPKFMSKTPTVKVEFNRQVLITNAFPNGYNPLTDGQITFSMFGIHNPISTAVTESFKIAIYYEEGVNEVTRYIGPGITFQATPSDKLSLKVTLSEKETGDKLSKLLIEGETEGSIPIGQGSYLELYMPPAFNVTNSDRVESSCTAVSGFSD